MKRLVMSCIAALLFLAGLHAEPITFKVLDSRCGSTPRGSYAEITWSNATLDAETITVDFEALTIAIKGKRESSTRVFTMLEDASNLNNNQAIVQAHDIMTGKGWDVQDIIIRDEYNHNRILRIRRHSVADKLQFFFYIDMGVYAYDVALPAAE